MDKKTSERIHAKRRALQRYHIDFTKEVRNHIKTQIRNSTGKFLYRQSRRVTVWEVTYENIPLRVVYDTKRSEIVTVLPQEVSDVGHEKY